MADWWCLTDDELRGALADMARTMRARDARSADLWGWWCARMLKERLSTAPVRGAIEDGPDSCALPREVRMAVAIWLDVVASRPIGQADVVVALPRGRRARLRRPPSAKRGRPRKAPEPAATPQTLAKLAADPILSALEAGLISHEQARAAHDIGEAIAVVAGMMGYRCNAGLGNVGGGGEFVGATADALDRTHTIWIRMMAAAQVATAPVTAFAGRALRLEVLPDRHRDVVLAGLDMWIRAEGARRAVRSYATASRYCA